MTKARKRSWFATNRKIHEPPERIYFTHQGFYKEESSKRQHTEDSSGVAYLWEEDWVLRQMSLGKCGNAADRSKQSNRGQDMFRKRIEDPQSDTLYRNCMWHLGVYAGVSQLATQSQERVHMCGRERVISDADDMEACQERAAVSANTSDCIHQESMQAAMIVLQPDLPASGINELLARGPAMAAGTQDAREQDIRRDVLVNLQRDTTIRAMEDIDYHQASAAA